MLYIINIYNIISHKNPHFIIKIVFCSYIITSIYLFLIVYSMDFFDSSFQCVNIIKHNDNLSKQKMGECKNDINFLFDDSTNFDIIDTRKFLSTNNDSKNFLVFEDIPSKISGTFNEDYDILYVDSIINKKLQQEKFTHLNGIKSRYNELKILSMKPQTYIAREKTLEEMNELKTEINDIESGERIKTYNNSVKDILSEYNKFKGKVKTIIFDIEYEKSYSEISDNDRYRIRLIESFLDIASEYIHIDVIRLNEQPADICSGCGTSLSKVAVNDEGTLRCPNIDCQTEHNVIILSKLAKDGSRINTNNANTDESIDNFLRAFVRYQGLQPDIPDESLYCELDEYFAQIDRPLGEEIRKLPLNSRGRRGDTNHKMLWNALSEIGRAGYYEDANLIGHIYWGWTLPNVMQYKERIISHYRATQEVFFQIPLEERDRSSSLGTQFRLMKHLQAIGHECYIDEFKIADNPDSLRTHNRLWRMMCEGVKDPTLHYIP